MRSGEEGIEASLLPTELPQDIPLEEAGRAHPSELPALRELHPRLSTKTPLDEESATHCGALADRLAATFSDEALQRVLETMDPQQPSSAS